MRLRFLGMALALLAHPLYAQTTPGARDAGTSARTKVSLNDGWRFLPDGREFAEKPWLSDAGWDRVSLPHTWNAHDPFDDVESYRRGTAWYRKTITLGEELRTKRIFLYFEGVNQTANVYVNGAFAGNHKGGYTAFAFDVTDLIKFDGVRNDNLIAVQVDNSHDPQIPPLSVGFALYGGIYRDVWLIATDPVHIDVTDHASSGLYVTAPNVTQARAEVRVRGTIVNSGSDERQVRVVSTLVDSSGAPVAEGINVVTAPARGRVALMQTLSVLANPHLWSPDRPYLYQLHTSVYDGPVLRDRVSNAIGLRWFSFDPNGGFSLNGEKLKLRGTNRHQDMAGFGSALSNDQHVRDLKSIKDMGANFLRLAHYPQDPAVLDAADKLGLLIWEEIPVVNHITPSDEFAQNSRTALREMIRQHYNHPSVVLWGMMNEVFLWSKAGARIGKQADTMYMRQVRDFAAGLDRIARAEDPTRFTTMAIHGSEDYDKSGVANVTQVLGVNVYSGWYSGVFEDFGNSLDRRHAQHPQQVIFISEYGSGSDLRLNSLRPERFDHSSTWHRMFHEAYLRQINARPYLAGSAIWSQFDFSQPHIGESMPNMNQKGMYTFDRKPKDVFYLYRANWNPEPMVYIASRDWTRRTGTSDTTAGPGRHPVMQPVDVYANVEGVELFANGKSLGTKQPDDLRKVSWQVPFADGENVIEARGTRAGQSYTDRMVIHFHYYPNSLRDPSVPFQSIAVNVGSNAQFSDEDGVVWEADQPYRAGAFGFVGGERKLMERAVIITNTPRTGLFVTYRTGLTGYRFDVPDGDYLVELDFAEPDLIKRGDRVFDVDINGRLVLTAIDLAGDNGTGRARTVVVNATASQNSGLAIGFRATSGQAILNGIRVTQR